MHLTFLPQRCDTRLTLVRTGDRLTLNEAVLDLAMLPEGAVLPPEAIDCPWIAGPVRRESGVLHLTLLLPHGADAPEAARFPAPLHLVGDGPVALPGTPASQEEL